MNAIYKYTSGKFRVFADAVNYQNKLRTMGFKDCFVIALKNGARIDLAEAKRILNN